MFDAKILSRLSLVAFTLLPVAGFGHHTLLGYDQSRLIELEGQVTAVFWRNPHVRLTVRVTDDAGERHWTVEGMSVNAMERAGISQAIFSPGDQIQLSGHLSSVYEDTLQPVSVRLEDGQIVVLNEESATAFGLIITNSGTVRDSAPSASVDAIERNMTGIFRVWTNRDRHWLRDVREWWARVHPLTESAQLALSDWDQETDDFAARCIPAGMPEAMLMPFPIEFVDGGDEIFLRIEEWDNTRTIHLAATNNDRAPYSPLGHSVGRWNRNTLIVETNRINYPYFNDQGIPQSQDVEIVEHFTFSENNTRLDWTATVVDPKTFTEPITMPDLHWDWVPGQEIKPYNCTVDD